MKYLLFEKSAIEELTSKTGFQSTEFLLGMHLIQAVYGQYDAETLDTVLVKSEADKGAFFVGKECSKTFLLFDLTQCKVLDEKENPDSLLLILQKVFRTALRIWNHQPFTSSERIHGSKSIIFPFVFTDHRRIVLERAAKCERLAKRGIDRPLLVYKYGTDDAPRGEEIAETAILREAGEAYLSRIAGFLSYFNGTIAEKASLSVIAPLVHKNAIEKVSDGGFMYLDYEQQLSKLTDTQRNVVQNANVSSPIRIDGPAGTGKTASMILRAYHLLQKAKAAEQSFSAVFFTHSESTKREIENAFSILPDASDFVSEMLQQRIKFTTLFEHCISTIKVNVSQVIEIDAAEAKQSQRALVEDAADKTYKEKFITFKPLLSSALKNAFNPKITPKGVLISMLQHEFSIQIKGRTDATIDEYYNLSPIKNALPVETKKDKEFVFSIFVEYQNMLRDSRVFDTDDIVVQALSLWNAPIWRRERTEQGFDYIFVDEMHLFNINEQNTFHYLTKSTEQKHIPICFALDYGQAIGDRGNTNQDYIEKAFGKTERSKYKTVFRSSPQIMNFCAAISASGALMFQSDFLNPYDVSSSGFTQKEEVLCQIPALYMYNNTDEMLESLKTHIDKCKREFQCKNYEIALISFEDALFHQERVSNIESIIQKKLRVFLDRRTSCLDKSIKAEDPILLFDPYSINGLEFKCVILIGVDEGRVPQTVGVSDVSANYIKYIAFNQLYLASSRAKYRLILLGDNLHGISSCLQYALQNHALEMKPERKC